MAFDDDDFTAFDRGAKPDVCFAGMLQYDGDLKLPARFLVNPPEITNTLTEVLIAAGLNEYAVSETQKYGHVTYFWNGNKSDKFSEELETYKEIPSDNVSFDQRPWMKSAEITDDLIEVIKSKKYDFIRCNYPNGDMVGHTGSLDSTIIGVEAVDLGLSRLIKVCDEYGVTLVVPADHGNADEMLEKNKKHSIEIVVDRLVMKDGIKSRLTESIETAGTLTGGLVYIDVIDGEELHFSQSYACPEHGVSIEDLSPRMFSFNNPYGACPKCTGIGSSLRVDPDLIMPNTGLSIRNGAIKASGWNYAEGTIAAMYIDALAEKHGFSVDQPVSELSDEAVNEIMYGTHGEKILIKRPKQQGGGQFYTDFEGIAANLERRYAETNSQYSRDTIEEFMSEVECPECHGERLNKAALSVTVGGRNIMEFCRMSVTEALNFVNGLELTPREAMIAKRRTHATIISYQAPALKKSGIYGELQELKETIAEYRESMQSAPERCDDLMNQIDHLAETCGCTGDLEQIEEYLYEYENSLITDGLHVMNAEEAQGLLHALDGEYVPVGTAGDVVKNPDILPSGRNLVQFDPRLVPTKTAYERGAKAAQLAVEQYKKQTGSYPDTTAVILWGLETSRSQGETVGQILYYLGLRLRTDRASFDDRLEIIPREELGRPRMDVVIHMCGFFRDMYPNLVDNLNEMLQQILALDETDEENYFAANTRKLAQILMKEQGMDETRAWEMASCRIFGPKEGEYATRLTDVVKKGSWKAAEELGTGFTADLSYAYSYRHRGEAAASVLKHQYENVDYISQIRNNVEYELTDLDHYYEFYGGLSKAVENQKGEKPVMLVADTVGEDVKVQDIHEALNRGIRTRLLNPAWIEGMMRHTYHGVQQIEKRFENVMGFAASTDAVDSQTFSEMTRCYVADEELRRQMTKSNKWAYMKMMERLMEANHRGYYQATEEELESIREAYIEAEGEAEE